MEKFEQTLKQTFKQIRESRAQAITEDTELVYRRLIEDKYLAVRAIDRSLDNLLLDLCPSSITSTQAVASDFKADEFVKKDIQYALDRRERVIELAIAVDRYEELFGPYSQANQVKELIPTWKSKISNEPQNS
jgi:hypothetical protein